MFNSFFKNNYSIVLVFLFFSLSCVNSSVTDNAQASNQAPSANQQPLNIVHRYVDVLNLTDDGNSRSMIDLKSDMTFLEMQGEAHEFRLIKEKKLEFQKVKYSNSSLEGSLLQANYCYGTYVLSGNKITFTSIDGFRAGESWSGVVSTDNGKVVLTFGNVKSYIEDDNMESL